MKNIKFILGFSLVAIFFIVACSKEDSTNIETTQLKVSDFNKIGEIMNSDTEKTQSGRRVEVHYLDANEPLVYENAKMTFIKGPFFCVHHGNSSYKHPIANIWCVKEAWCSNTQTEDDTEPLVMPNKGVIK